MGEMVTVTVGEMTENEINRAQQDMEKDGEERKRRQTTNSLSTPKSLATSDWPATRVRWMPTSPKPKPKREIEKRKVRASCSTLPEDEAPVQ